MNANIIDILIVGAGPVGLFLANELARHGVKSFKIIEKLPAISILSKAVALHARSLEMIPNVTQFHKQGTICHGASFYAGSKRLGGVVFDRLKSEYHYALMLPQDETEQILNDHLRDVHGCRVDRGVELLDLVEFTHPVGDGSDREEPLVRATIRNTKDSSEQVILTRYVIGCDGAHSVVRKTMKVQLVGITTKDIWMTADIQIKEEEFPKTNEITGVFDERGFVAFFPLKEKERRFRMAINVINPPGDVPLGQELSLEELQKVVDERSTSMGHKVTFYNPRWITTFKINERRVESMRKSRLIVCGDAAHVHSPAGGQGMNTGIQDAHNLAWKLALIFQGRGKEEVLLRSFANERESNAERLLKNTGTMRSLIGTDSAIVRAIRNSLMPVLTEIEFVKEKLANNMGQMDIAYPQSPLTSHYGEPRGFFKLFKSNSPSQFLGGRLPYFHLTKVADASSKFSHDIVKATTKHHVFILDDEGEHKSIEQLQTKLKANKLNDLVQIEVITNEGSHVEGVQVWRDDTKEFHKAFHLEEHSKGLAVLVRPDGYIGFISGLSTADIDEVVSHLKNYLF